MGWTRTGEASKLEKIVGALEMAAGGLAAGFTFSPWGDKYLSPEMKPYMMLLSTALIVRGRQHLRHEYEPDEQHPHALAYTKTKLEEHGPKIRQVMDYVAPRAEQLYSNWRARPRYA